MRTVYIDVKQNLIQIINEKKIFTGPFNRYILEQDEFGFSCIQKMKDGTFRYRNWLKDHWATDKLIWIEEVMTIIRRVEE